MMGALIRALTNNAVENIEEALGMTDATSSAMKHAIAEWYAAWYGRVPTKTEDPCQRLPYAIVNKLCKATFGEYDSGLQHTDSAKGKYLDCVRSAFDACKTSFMTQAMIGGEAWAKPVPMPDGRLTWQIVGRDSIIILGRDASGIPSDVALCEKSVSADHHFYTLVERRTSFAGRLTIQYRLYCSDNKSTLGRRVPLTDPDLTQQEQYVACLQILYPRWKELPDANAALRAAFTFINEGKEDEQQGFRPRLVDWEQDAALIAPAVDKVLGYSCRRCGYLHWWEFLGAFHGIGDGLFAQVVNIRNKRARGKMLDKSEQEFARENAAVIKIHAAESAEDKAEKERLLDLLGR